MLVTQRRAPRELDVVAVGPDAQKWLTIAQAFAGPPGPGRGSMADGRAGPPDVRSKRLSLPAAVAMLMTSSRPGIADDGLSRGGRHGQFPTRQSLADPAA